MNLSDSQTGTLRNNRNVSFVISTFSGKNRKKMFCRTSLASIALFLREKLLALENRRINSHSNNLNKSIAHGIFTRKEGISHLFL